MSKRKRKKRKKPSREELNKRIVKDVLKGLQNKEQLRDIFGQVAKSRRLKVSKVKNIWFRHNKPEEKGHGNRLLTLDDESGLLAVVETFSNADKDLTIKQLGLLIIKWKNINPTDGGVWLANSFISRFPGRLKLTKSKSLCVTRKHPEILKGIELYISALDDENRSGRYNSFQILTYDEFIASVPSGRSAVLRVASRSKSKSNIARGKSGKAPSICLFTAADGSMLLVVIIYPVSVLKRGVEAQDFPLREWRTPRGFNGTFVYAFNESG